MAASTTQDGFQVYGSRNDMVIIPSPGQMRPLPKTAALYLISSPLPPDIQAIKFCITSHDHGWSDNPQGRTWTWFAVSILRPLAEGVEGPIYIQDTEYIKSQPDDFGALIQDLGYYFEDIPTRDGFHENQTPSISIPLINNPVGRRWQHHSITWSRVDCRNGGSHLIPLLEEGDRLAIWACAQVCKTRRGRMMQFLSKE